MKPTVVNFLAFSKTFSVLKPRWEISSYMSESRALGHHGIFKFVAPYHRDVKQIYFFDNTEEHYLHFKQPYQTLQDIKQFRVRALKGGFQRRPELIRQRIPVYPAQDISSIKTYGLFDKCERIQQELTEKVLELMNPEAEAGLWMLDIGCGHGWSLSLPAMQGFYVTGIDLDMQALSVIQDKINCTYLPESVYVVRADVTNDICFRENMFDFAISISFLQWLFVNKNTIEKLDKFFCSLSSVLKSSGKAGVQFYPRNIVDVNNVIISAQKFFKGALVSDFPHTDRGRKLFLVLVNDK